MTDPKTDNLNLGIFLGTGQQDAHKVMAYLFSKYVRIDADETKVFSALEANHNFDDKVYETAITAIGENLYTQLKDTAQDYCNAFVHQQKRQQAEKFNEQLPAPLRNTFIVESQPAFQKPGTAQDYKEIMETVQKDLMDFENACLNLDNERKTIATEVLAYLQVSYLETSVHQPNQSRLKLLGPENI